MSTVAERREARRRVVIEATCRVILRDGPGAASMKAIAKELGTTVGVITHNFSDKDELVQQAVHHVVGELFESAIAGAAGMAGIERLRCTLDGALPTTPMRHSRWQVWVSYLGEIMGSRTLLEDERRQNRRFLEVIEVALEDLRSAGKLDPKVDPKREAHTAMSLVDGLGLDAVLHPDLYGADLQREIIERYCVNLLRTNPSS